MGKWGDGEMGRWGDGEKIRNEEEEYLSELMFIRPALLRSQIIASLHSFTHSTI